MGSDHRPGGHSPKHSDARTAPAWSRSGRRPVRLEAFVIKDGGQPVSLVITELFGSGCIVETETDLRQGELVQLSILGGVPEPVRVGWRSDDRAELRFERNSPLAERPARRAPRVPLAAEASLRRAGHTACSVKVFNASSLGCSCEHIDQPSIGERVWLKFDGFDSLEAEVCWIAGPKVGLSFARPIHQAVFDLMVERLGKDGHS